MTIGEELHSNEEAELLEQGSLQRNRYRYVERAEIWDAVTVIVNRLVQA